MPAGMKIALVAVLVAASAATARASNGKHGAAHGAAAARSAGGNGATLAPFTQFEHEWIARASRPNNM